MIRAFILWPLYYILTGVIIVYLSDILNKKQHTNQTKQKLQPGLNLKHMFLYTDVIFNWIY